MLRLLMHVLSANHFTTHTRLSALHQLRRTAVSSSSSRNLGSRMKNLIDSQKYQQASYLFDQPFKTSTNVSINQALRACIKLKDHRGFTKILEHLSNKSLNDPYIQTSIIQFYMQQRDVDKACRFLSTVDSKSNHMYGAMFKGLISNNMPEKVLDIFDEMVIEPDGVTLLLVFSACAQLATDRAKQLGTKLLTKVSHHHRNAANVMSSAVHMLMKFGDIDGAEKMFRMIKKKDIVTYSAMIKGYADNKLLDRALDLYQEMNLTPDEFIYSIVLSICSKLPTDRAKNLGKNLLIQMPGNLRQNNTVMTSAIHMLTKFGNVKEAEKTFELIKTKNVATYGAMMKGYTINSEPLKCLNLYTQMKEQAIDPNETIFVLLIKACANIGMRRRSQTIVDQIPMHFLSNQWIQNSLINLWSKVGLIDRAQQIFRSIKSPDVISFNSIMNGYGRNGMAMEAIKIYRDMPGHLRDEVSHICALNACSHSGFLEEARAIFDRLSIKTEKITCTMIDCLSRLFMFDEAQQLMDDYEKSKPPSLVMHMVILSGARNQRRSIISKRIYDRMRSLFPHEKEHLRSGAILLANIYSSLGDHQGAEEMRLYRIDHLGKDRTKTGLSWTEINDELVQFKAHDHSHPRSSEIYAELERLSAELLEHGHTYDSSWITRSLREEETVESVLCGHSERLAIAFNLIQQPPPSMIQITKNLRVCGDCHQATKLIAKIRQCEIVVRDANRIHHFYPNGQCSCQDHF